MSTPRQRLGSSWRAKLAFLLAAFAVVPLLISTYMSLREQAELVHRQTLASVEALATAKATAIDQFADFRRRDAERMASLLAPFLMSLNEAKQTEPEVPEIEPEELPELEDAEESRPAEDEENPEQPEASETPEPKEPEPEQPKEPEPTKEQDSGPVAQALGALRGAVDLIAWDLEEFEEILVLDADGRVIVSTFQQHEGHSARSLQYFQKGLNGTFLEPVFLSPITGELTMVIATPIEDAEHKTLGVLAARLNLKRFFRLLGDTTGLGETGETVAGRVDGDSVIVVAPTRHEPGAALETRIPLGTPSARGLQEAARGQSGSGRGLDYRDEPVFAAWKHVPSLDWGIVVKIDEAEALAPVDQSRQAAMIASAILVVLAIAAALFVSQLFVRPLHSLREATERISRGDFDVTLDIRSNDEIGKLADSFDRMVAAIKFFREHSRFEDEDYDSAEEGLSSNSTSASGAAPADPDPSQPPER